MSEWDRTLTCCHECVHSSMPMKRRCGAEGVTSLWALRPANLVRLKDSPEVLLDGVGAVKGREWLFRSVSARSTLQPLIMSRGPASHTLPSRSFTTSMMRGCCWDEGVVQGIFQDDVERDVGLWTAASNGCLEDAPK
jgi:hypothetical protein